jgi:F-type H+-transporting ATPase subunit gamma
MPSLESLKRKIESAEDLESVVGTMKTLAAVSIRQYETAVESLTDYYQTVEAGLRMVLWQAAEAPQLPESDGGTGALVFGSDQGLCGSFNEQIVNYAVQNMPEPFAGPDGGWFLAVGGRAAARLQEGGHAVDGEFPVPGSATGIIPLVQELLHRIDAWRSTRRLGRIVLFYNQRRSASSYQPHQVQLLPVDAERFYRLQQRTWPSRTLPLFTMERPALLSALMRHYLFVSLFRACAESLAGENASRIAAMQAAERNIEERLDELRSEYNQLRQTAITEELLDVITGYEALTQNKKG